MILDVYQRGAVDAPGSCSVIAGPGAGKTRVLVARAQRVAADGEQALVLTFTRAAAHEVLRRLEGETAPTGLVHATTLHGFAAWHLGLHPERVGLRPGFTVRDEVEAGALWRQVGAELRIRSSSPKFIGRDPRARDRYERLLLANNSVDYDQVLGLSLDLLRRGPVPHYDEILVDEAQDLSATQWEAVELLAARRRLFVVGDPSQSIYRFAGAVPERMPPSDCALPVNYRSTSAVVAAASRLALVPRPVQQTVAPSAGDWAGWVGCVDELDLAEHVQLVSGGEWGGAAVLGRTWAEVSAAYAALRTAGVPAMVVRPGSLFRTPAARRVIAGLRCLWNPADGLSLASFVGERVPPGILAGAIDAGVPVVTWAAEHWEPAAVLRDVEGEGAPLAMWFARELGAEPEVVAALDLPGTLAEVIAAALEGDVRALPAAADCVACTTIHAAKGAEWDHVWVLGCEEPIRGDIEDERRAFYVATTRAKQTCAWVTRVAAANRFVREALGRP
jgi:DNA helicase-2/ATP-dependent DNA helicase PcrA